MAVRRPTPRAGVAETTSDGESLSVTESRPGHKTTNKQKNMENFEGEKMGVLEHKIVDHHYSVDIRWKDGKESQHNFPENGFAVYDTETNHKLGFLSGPEALKILEEHASSENEEDFSWTNYVKQKVGKKGK